ncbi:unnamed protein product [Prunus brigantina]
MKFVHMVLVAMVVIMKVVVLLNMHSYEACRVLRGEENLMVTRMKKDVLQIRGVNPPSSFSLIKQILRGLVPSGSPNLMKP